MLRRTDVLLSIDFCDRSAAKGLKTRCFAWPQQSRAPVAIRAVARTFLRNHADLADEFLNGTRKRQGRADLC